MGQQQQQQQQQQLLQQQVVVCGAAQAALASRHTTQAVFLEHAKLGLVVLCCE
jgi:hypothetical protein